MFRCALAAGRQIEATNVELPVLRPIDSEDDHAMERQMSDSTVTSQKLDLFNSGAIANEFSTTTSP